MARQMDLFDEGGLLQEGGTVDEVSGNEVPTGSLKEEVRDDIPAQLSEGEFVMPADVVRYHGLDKMMALRDEAKMGLARMEAMGQMGNSEEATIPDGIPFNMEDLELEYEEDEEGPMEMQVGGYVPSQPYGIYQQPNMYGTTSMPSQFANYAQSIQPASQFQPFGQGQPQPAGQPAGAAGYVPTYYNVPTGTGTQQQQYTFGQLMPTIGGTSETREYRNEAGQSLYIPFVNGEPVYPIPEGYTEYKPEDVAPTEPDQPGTTQPTETGGDDGGPDNLSTTLTKKEQTARTMTTLGFAPSSEADHAKAFGGHTVFGIKNPALRSATFDQAKYQLGTISPLSGIGTAVAAELGMIDASMNDMAIAGQQGKEAALSAMGMASPSQLGASEQATMLGSVMSAAHKARSKGLDVGAAIEAEIAKHPEAIKAGAISAMQNLGYTSDKINDADVVAEAASKYGDMAKDLNDQINATLSSGAVTSIDPVTGEKRAVTSATGPVLTAAARAKVDALREQEKRAIAAAKAIAVQDPKAQAAIARGNIERGDAVIGTPTAGDVARARAAADRAYATGEYRDDYETMDATPTAAAKSTAGVSTAAGLSAGDRIAQTANALMARGVSATDALRAAETAEKSGTIDPDVAASLGGRPSVTQASYRDTGRPDDSGPSEPSGPSVGFGAGQVDRGLAEAASRGATGVGLGRGEDSPTAARDARDSGSDSGSGDKIVCTAMNNAYGFGSFRQTVWLQHSKNMDPAYQKGYHRIFKPLIKFAYKDDMWYNKFVRSTLEGIARRRTADIWMQKHGKRHLRGAVERAVLEPLCYIVGKIK